MMRLSFLHRFALISVGDLSGRTRKRMKYEEIVGIAYHLGLVLITDPKEIVEILQVLRSALPTRQIFLPTERAEECGRGLSIYTMEEGFLGRHQRTSSDTWDKDCVFVFGLAEDFEEKNYLLELLGLFENLELAV